MFRVSLQYNLYLGIVEIVHKNLHDTREDKDTGAGDEEGVDVVK